MEEYELNNADPEDIDDLLMKVQTSFNIQFKTEDFTEIKTFGALCDLITNKIELENSESCTSQQAFYKLRDAVFSTLGISKETITPDSKLIDILPKNNRRESLRLIENQLGFKLKILRAPIWLTSTLFIGSLLSIIMLFFDLKIGLAGLISSVLGLRIAGYFGTVLDFETVRQVTEKMTREHYSESRRNPNTFNRNEIEKILIEWFSEELIIDKSKLTREAEFN